jgi:glycosyltransferase involved in cell wall biosynthesis
MNHDAPRQNILMMAPGGYPAQGGIETQMQLLIQELVKKNYRITIVTRERAGSPKIEKSDEIHLYRLANPLVSQDVWNGFFFILKNIKDIKKIITDEHIDIIHVHQSEMSCSFVYLLKKFIHIPVVTTVHTSLHVDKEYLNVRMNLKEPFRWIFRIFPVLWFEKKSFRTSNYLITISKKLETYCRTLNGEVRVIRISNAINLQQFNPDTTTAEFHIKDRVILCPGRISPEKGQVCLVDALNLVREKVPAHVVFMGSGSPDSLQELKNQISLRHLDDFIHILPAQPYEAMPGFYKAADLIAIPSLSESFGLAVLENMAIGNVVVASDVGGIPELIENGKSGLLVPPANPQLLAEAVILALTNAQLREDLKKNAIKKAQEYDFNMVVLKVERCYQNITNLKGLDQSK